MKIEVELVWRGNDLMAGEVFLGRVYRARDAWAGTIYQDDLQHLGYFPTESAARAAVEAAVARELTGGE